jgi:hypothetical protein
MLPKLDSPNKLFGVMDTIFTYRMKNLHVVDSRDVIDANGFLMRILPLVIAFFGSVWRGAMVPVFGNNTEEVIAQLQEAGLERAHLPLSMGGALDYDQFVMDWLRSKGLNDGNCETELPTGAIVNDTAHPKDSNSGQWTQAILPGQGDEE